jgi:hypothetical protein
MRSFKTSNLHRDFEMEKKGMGASSWLGGDENEYRFFAENAEDETVVDGRRILE